MIYKRIKIGSIPVEKRGKYRFLSLETVDQLWAAFPPKPARCYTATQARRKLGYSETHLTRLFQSGHVRAVRYGERWLVDADHVDALVRRMKAEGLTRMHWPGLVDFLKERKAA